MTKALALSKFTPLPQRPTLRHVARGVNELHDCYDKGQGENKVAFSKLEGQIALMQESQKTVRMALGIDLHDPTVLNQQPPLKKSIALMTQTEALFKGMFVIGSGIGGTWAIWKFVAFMLPFLGKFGIGLWGFAKALNIFVIGH